MKLDIVFPNNNEEEFIQLAEKLGWEGLCFIYKYKNTISIKNKINKLGKATNLKLFYGLIAEPKDIIKAKKISDFVIVKSSEKDQNLLEKYDFDLLFGMEFLEKKDAMHFRASGFNQVLAKLAKKNSILIGISLKQIIDSAKKPKILGRIMQNIRLCKKYNLQQAIASFAEKPYEMKSPTDMISFLITLGMDFPNAKKSPESVAEKINKNIIKKSPDYFGEGIELLKA